MDVEDLFVRGGAPDDGISAALALCNLPNDGAVLEIGYGTGRNLVAMQNRYPCAIGYEVRDDYHEELREYTRAHQLQIDLRLEDIFDAHWPPEPYAMVVVGIAIYNPKQIFRELLKNLWERLAIGGILHIEFAGERDENLIYPWLTWHCEPDPSEELSFLLNGSGYVPPGVLGASFWTDAQITALLAQLGNHTLVHWEVREFTVTLPNHEAWPDPEGVWKNTLFRSFKLVTVQKG